MSKSSPIAQEPSSHGLGFAGRHASRRQLASVKFVCESPAAVQQAGRGHIQAAKPSHGPQSPAAKRASPIAWASGESRTQFAWSSAIRLHRTHIRVPVEHLRISRNSMVMFALFVQQHDIAPGRVVSPCPAWLSQLASRGGVRSGRY